MYTNYKLNLQISLVVKLDKAYLFSQSELDSLLFIITQFNQFRYGKYTLGQYEQKYIKRYMYQFDI